MAKKSKIAKNNQAQVLVARYADRRAELTAIIKDPEASYEDKREAYQKLAKMPRDASATRYRNRCGVAAGPVPTAQVRNVPDRGARSRSPR